METATIIAKLVRSAFPDQSVSVKVAPFTYLHHDTNTFEDRTVPSFRVNVTAKTTRETYTGRKIAVSVDPWEVVTVLRNAGYFALYRGEIIIADVTEDALPVNLAFPFEWK